MRKFYVDQPISDEQADKLYEAIFVGLGEGTQSLAVGCDHTLTFTKKWSEANGIDFNIIKTWLNEHGGFCDCEVLFNVMPDEDDAE